MAAVAVTPPGHDLGRWAGRRRSAERVSLIELRQHMGFDAGAELVVFGAHPDDETLGLGRLIHAWVDRGGPVTAVVATAGEACLDHVAPRVPGLGRQRLAEWASATEILGVTNRVSLGLADGTLDEHEAALSSAAERVVARSGTEVRPVLAAPWRRDPHPDHRAVGRVVGSLGRVLGLPVIEYGVWMTYWSDPDDLDDDDRRLLVLLTNDRDEEVFEQACGAFSSQLLPLAPGLGPVVPPAMLAHLSEQLLVLPRGGKS